MRLRKAPVSDEMLEAAAPIAAPIVHDSNSPLHRVLGLFRDIRQESQNMRKSISELQQKKALSDNKVRDHAIIAEFAIANEKFGYSGDKIEQRLTDIRDLVSKDSDQYDQWGDLLTEVEDDWHNISELRKQSSATATDILDLVEKMDPILHEIILLCARNTIPPRVDQHLDELRVGQTLDFNKEFQDELDSAQDRQDVLNFIASHPTVIHGMVDTSSGLIYKSGPLRRQIESYVLMTLLVVGGIGPIFLLSFLASNFGLSNSPVQPARTVELVIGYFFVFLGSLVHMGVDALKQSRAAKNNIPTALGNLFLWFHVKETSEILGILTLWVGFWGLVFTVQKIDWQVAFFVGFSIDSIAEIFLQRFTTYASTQTQALTKQFSPAA